MPKSKSTQERTLYPVYCAWCKRRKTIVGWARVPGSHGICRKHEKELNRQTEKIAGAEAK
jgi:hypothetical protein